jgi:hypothetical protein
VERETVDQEYQKKPLWYERGVTYFDKRMERSFFFFVTIVMLAWGILEKFLLW